MKNSFYVCEEYYPFLYEKLEHAEWAVAWSLRTVPGVPAAGAKYEHNGKLYWQNAMESKVFTTNPNEPILFLEEKIIDFKHDTKIYREKFWRVIIGEKIGWLIKADWLQIKPLELLEKYGK